MPALESLWSVDDFKIKADNYFKFTEELGGWKPKLILKDHVAEGILSELLETAAGILDSLLNMEDYHCR